MMAPTSTVEDARAAAAMATSLSQYLISAALAIIAAQAAALNAFVDKRERLGIIYWMAFFTLVATVASIICGGRAIDHVYQAGFEGNWQVGVHEAPFSLQANFLLGGLGSFLISIVVGLKVGTRRTP